MTKTFDKVVAEARRRAIELNPVDGRSSRDRFEFIPTEEGQRLAYLKPLEGTAPGLPPLHLSEHALGQLMARADYPVRLLDCRPAKLNHLWVNRLLQHHLGEREAFIRPVWAFLFPWTDRVLEWKWAEQGQMALLRERRRSNGASHSGERGCSDGAPGAFPA